MMSAGPYIQAHGNLQSYNRYSYVMNNPMLFTDPSGFSWLGSFFNKLTGSSWSDFRDNAVKPVAVIAIAYYTGQWAGGAVSGGGLGFGAIGAGAIGGAAGGAASALFNGGDAGQIFKGAMLGGISGAGFGWAGLQGTPSNFVEIDAAANSVGRYAAHALVGCVSSVAGGGKCGSGAASAVFGKFTSNAIGGTPGQWDTAQFAATVVAGGIGSAMGGGKFENGAMTAAYGYLFNALSAKTIRSLFTTPGHHPFTRQMAIQFTDVMTDEAVDYVSRRTIGEHVNWDRADPNNPHKWSNEAGHPQYNKDALDIGNKYIEANGISKDNPMTVRQAAELGMKLRQHEYNRSVQDYTNQQMRSGNIRWRGVSRSSGGSSGGPE